MAKKPRIRAIAICLMRRGDRILVQEGTDKVTGERFARPLGGGIDFTEHSRTTVIREIREELGADIVDVKQLGIVESIYVYEGEPGHQIVFVYDGRFVDEHLYDQPTLVVREGKRTFKARWRSLAELRQGSPTLVPKGLWELL